MTATPSAVLRGERHGNDVSRKRASFAGQFSQDRAMLATTLAGVQLKVWALMRCFGDTLDEAEAQIDGVMEGLSTGEALALSILKDTTRMTERTPWEARMREVAILSRCAVAALPLAALFGPAAVAGPVEANAGDAELVDLGRRWEARSLRSKPTTVSSLYTKP